jgi:hypothetical protein
LAECKQRERGGPFLSPEECSKLNLHTSNQREEFFQSVRDLFLFALGWWHFILTDVRQTRTRDSPCERDHILSLSVFRQEVVAELTGAFLRW